jgi:hypothetical protein
MEWNEHHQQWLMKLVPLGLMFQEFTQEELDKGEKEVFNCGSVVVVFKGLKKDAKNEYEMTVKRKEPSA